MGGRWYLTVLIITFLLLVIIQTLSMMSDVALPQILGIILVALAWQTMSLIGIISSMLGCTTRLKALSY